MMEKIKLAHPKHRARNSEDSDDTGMEGKKSHSRSINREGKEMLASVNTDRIVKINEGKRH